MSRRPVVIAACVLAAFVSGCKAAPSTGDAGEPAPFTAGNPSPREACTGGCAANQRCNVSTHTCEDACGGCAHGTCVKLTDGHYQCQDPVTSCNGAACLAGQVACLNGACSCISTARGADDSCRGAGQWCHGATCADPAPLEQCDPNGPACATGFSCSDSLFGTPISVCLRSCSFDANACDRGDFCNGGLCVPTGIFTGAQCAQNVPLPDGGLALQADGGLAAHDVTPGSTCLLKKFTGSGFATNDVPGTGSGTCLYATYRLWDQGILPLSTCRPPGQALEGQACTTDFGAATIASQCATGLHCAVTGSGASGVCLRTCNANPPRFGITPQPSCGADEACVNLYRYSDPNDNAVLGVCMKSCQAFDATVACAPIGGTATSCVPAAADGTAVLSGDGRGICAPRQATVFQEGQGCPETDPFRGAVCASGQVCTALGSQSATPACTRVCDLTCSPATGSPPARCATQPNATCTGGKTCQQVSSSAGVTVGLCR